MRRIFLLLLLCLPLAACHSDQDIKRAAAFLEVAIAQEEFVTPPNGVYRSILTDCTPLPLETDPGDLSRAFEMVCSSEQEPAVPRHLDELMIPHQTCADLLVRDPADEFAAAACEGKPSEHQPYVSALLNDGFTLYQLEEGTWTTLSASPESASEKRISSMVPLTQIPAGVSCSKTFCKLR